MDLRGAIGTRRRRLAVAPRRIDRERARLLGDPSLTERERAVLERVEVHVDPRDAMHVGDTEHYLRVGLSALRCIEAAGVQQHPPRRILDLPCGHGRVLRVLHAAYPEAELVACDIDRHGVDFCAQLVGARPVYSASDIASVDLPQDVDLVWCGSLVTHLGAEGTKELLGKLGGTLAPGGALVFTTHGEWVADRLRSGEADYQLTPDGVRQVLAGYEEDGFGYADYPWESGYGVSLTSQAWVERNGPLEVARFAERCWDGHQDVYALVKPPGA